MISLERRLYAAFTLSLIVHTVILARIPKLNILPAAKNEEFQVTYIKKPKDYQPPVTNKPGAVKKISAVEPFLRMDAKITANNNIPPPFIDKERTLAERMAVSERIVPFTKPAFNSPEAVVIKKKITLPPIDLDKIDNPSYISYYQIVREKIRRCAYQYYSRQDTGEVFITFTINRNGQLNQIQLIPDKSSGVAYLKEVALQSVNEAAPFPPFPQDLDYPTLSFNVVISFEIE